MIVVERVHCARRYIVSASGDRNIKVWSTDTGNFVRTLKGHSRGIACLQYRDGLCVSGSSDNTIRCVCIVVRFVFIRVPHAVCGRWRLATAYAYSKDMRIWYGALALTINALCQAIMKGALFGS